MEIIEVRPRPETLEALEYHLMTSDEDVALFVGRGNFLGYHADGGMVGLTRDQVPQVVERFDWLVRHKDGIGIYRDSVFRDHFDWVE